MFYDFLLRFPNELDKLSPIGQLTEMQHYGLPTRLLDITENPLVALYMACNTLFNNEKSRRKFGEVIVYPVRNEPQILDSSEILLNASLAMLSEEQKLILRQGKNQEEINNIKQQMIGYISRHQNFPQDFDYKILNKSYFAEVGNLNQRITAQSGAFIIFGLDENYIKKWPSTRNSNIRLLIKDKVNIYNELKTYNITDASMFPDKDHAARFIKEKYK